MNDLFTTHITAENRLCGSSIIEHVVRFSPVLMYVMCCKEPHKRVKSSNVLNFELKLHWSSWVQLMAEGHCLCCD